VALQPDQRRLASGGSAAGSCRDKQLKSSRTKFIVQQTARNHPDMASITDGAVATIRIVTYFAPAGAIDMLPPVIKMPAGPSVVDNLLGGGDRLLKRLGRDSREGQTIRHQRASRPQ
jgi:hypothetical protein